MKTENIWRAATVLLMMLLTTATAWAETVTANYMNADGTTSSHEATVIDQNNKPIALGDDGLESWYVVTENVSYTEQVLFRGDVYLILGDGKTMSIGTEDNPINNNPGLSRGNNNASLTIYGATADGGTLKAYNNYNGGSSLVIGKSFTLNSGSIIIKSLQSYAIFAYNGDIIINGGKLDATSTGSNHAIYCLKTVNINGGNVTATTTGNSNGIYSYNGITINGGNVNVSGSSGLYSSNGNITINGGNVTSTGNGYNNTIGWIYSYQGNIILGWTNDTDYINVGGYDVYKGVISVASGKSFQAANGNIYMGILFDGQTPANGKFSSISDLNAAIGGKILTPVGSTMTFYDVSIASTTNGTVTANYASAPEGTVVRLNVTPAEGYSIGTVKYNDGSDHVITPVNDVYSFTMPAKNVTVSATFTVMASDHFTQNGDEYTIHDADGWIEFCNAIDDGETFSGKTVKLGNDITVSRMAGSGAGSDLTTNDRPFCGTFDGQGNTLTFNYGSSGSPADENNLAPFRYVNNATIQHLHVTGDIYTKHVHAGGIVGMAYGTTNITDCRSSVNIVSSINGDGTHGGIMSCSWTGSTTNITGCVFDGSIQSASGYATDQCGGFVGWRNATINVKNCLLDADLTTIGAATGQQYPSATFVRNGEANRVTNSYYTAALGTAQGKQRRSITAGENVTVTISGTATTYSTSGITAYPTGIKYNDVLYAGNGDNVSLTLSNSVGSGYSYTVNAGTLSENTLTMPDADVVVSLGNNTNADWLTEYNGTEDDPYMIYNTDQLNLLAYRVNGTHDQTRQEDGFEGKYFKLGDDITYTYTKAWNDASSTENNYEPIGGYYNNSNIFFCGNFDGNGHTISGIRIFKSGTGNGDMMNGIFGGTTGANIHDLTLADTRITGYHYTGGIAGKNASKYSNNVNIPSTITRCHVAADVAICAAQIYTWYHGGIVGYNYGSSTVSQCTSAATLTIVNSSARPSAYYGGIAGYNEGTLTDNLVIGATVPAADNNYYGAIAGFQGTLQRNYYYNCTVAGVQNATCVGSQNADVTYYNGALPGIILYDNSTKIDINSHILTTVGNAAVPRVTLSGRTLFKDGAWNTLCLPFDVTAAQMAETTHPLYGAVIKELDASGIYDTDKQTGFDASTGTLYLYFKDVSPSGEQEEPIKAGKPYIVKWASGSNIVNPMFSEVTVSTDAPTGVTLTDGKYIVSAQNSGLNTVQFIGTYSPTDIYSPDKDNLYLGSDGNSLYYPWGDSMTEYYLNACRAYFHVDLTGAANIRAFVLNFGDGGETESQGISDAPRLNDKGEMINDKEAGAWYDLQGRRIRSALPLGSSKNGQSSARPKGTLAEPVGARMVNGQWKKGLYIHNGRKVVIK